MEIKSEMFDREVIILAVIIPDVASFTNAPRTKSTQRPRQSNTGASFHLERQGLGMHLRRNARRHTDIVTQTPALTLAEKSPEICGCGVMVKPMSTLPFT